MNARLSFCVLAISALVFFGMAGAVSADFLDNFEGTALDTGVWTASEYTAPYTATVADNGITLTANGHAASGELMTNDTGALTVGKTAYYRLGNAPILNEVTSMLVFGGWDTVTTGSPHIQMGNWGTGPDGWTVEICDGTTTSNYPIAAPLAADLYSIAWTTGSVVVSRNGTPIVTDTTVVPGSGASMMVEAFVNSGSVQFDGIGVNMVPLAQVTITPEPSVLTLVGTGLLALLAYAWRKRK
jgi:hypothetical protein